MSEKKNELPSLRKTPLDFLSREEARQAVKPEAALDTSAAAQALQTAIQEKFKWKVAVARYLDTVPVGE
jgi:hypothetical protein